MLGARVERRPATTARRCGGARDATAATRRRTIRACSSGLGDATDPRRASACVWPDGTTEEWSARRHRSVHDARGGRRQVRQALRSPDACAAASSLTPGWLGVDRHACTRRLHRRRDQPAAIAAGASLPDLSPHGDVRSAADARAAIRSLLSTDRETRHAVGRSRRRVRRAGQPADGRRVPRRGRAVLPQRAGARAGRGALAVLPRARLHGQGEPAKPSLRSSARCALRPDDVATLVWLGDVHLDQGQPELAEPLFAKALVAPAALVAALFGLGRAALARREYARRGRQFEQALAVDPRASIVHYPLALAYRGLGDTARAEAHLRQRGGVEVGPPDPLMEELRGLLHSAVAYENRGDSRARQRRLPRRRRRISARASNWRRTTRRCVTSWAPRCRCRATRAARSSNSRKPCGGRRASRRRTTASACCWPRRPVPAGGRAFFGRGAVRAELRRSAPAARRPVAADRTARCVAAALRAADRERSSSRCRPIRLRDGARPTRACRRGAPAID